KMRRGHCFGGPFLVGRVGGILNLELSDRLPRKMGAAGFRFFNSEPEPARITWENGRHDVAKSAAGIHTKSSKATCPWPELFHEFNPVFSMNDAPILSVERRFDQAVIGSGRDQFEFRGQHISAVPSEIKVAFVMGEFSAGSVFQ